MRRLIASITIIAAAALASCGQPPAAPEQNQAQAPRPEGPGVRDPLGFVRAVYAGYAGNSAAAPPAYPTGAYSPRLAQAFEAAGADGAALDFNYWVNGQDWELSDVNVAEAPPPAPERRIILARFRNMGNPVVNRFEFIRAGERWQLDEVVAEPQGDTPGWRLSELLEDR